MNQHGIAPERITKPIQLLAAWLIGLFATNGSFLVAAQQLDRPAWGSALLVVASVINVPVFIGALFILQTKFRPQMQEDLYYAKYLDEERKFQSAATSLSGRLFDEEIRESTQKIIASIGAAAQGKEGPIEAILRGSQTELLVYKHGSNRTLCELFLAPEAWSSVVDRWSSSRSFTSSVDGLVGDGLAEKPGDDIKELHLTDLGRQVATEAQAQELLFSQKKPAFWNRRLKPKSAPSESDRRGEEDPVS